MSLMVRHGRDESMATPGRRTFKVNIFMLLNMSLNGNAVHWLVGSHGDCRYVGNRMDEPVSLHALDFIGNSVYSAYAELQQIERQTP